MFDFLAWLLVNWKVILNIGFIIFLLGMVPSITIAIRNAKNGVRESLTPLGFIVLLLMLVLFFTIKSFITKI